MQRGDRGFEGRLADKRPLTSRVAPIGASCICYWTQRIYEVTASY